MEPVLTDPLDIILGSAKFWIPIAISALLSLLAIGVAVYSARVSNAARRDARAVAGLDVEPEIGLSTYFSNTEDRPRHFLVLNVGPVEIVQFEIQLIARIYQPDLGKVKATKYGTDGRFRIDNFAPWTSRTFEFPDLWLDVNARMGEPAKHNVMEIRMTYRRPVDRRQYTKSALYFVNPEGSWVGENDSSLPPDQYKPIKQAALAQASNYKGYLGSSDVLHRIDSV